ncbi:MAG TPA: KTSC domain-containing protein [Kamptonema sp.]|nr:KTSC domain-containing protein [Kamptonema sp.]
MKLTKIDLSNIVGVGHSNGQLGLLIDRGDQVEYIEIDAPEAALQGLQQVAFIANNDLGELSGSIEANQITSSQDQIAMLPVSSSMAKAIGYDADSQTLQIEFRSGAVYQYADVEEDTWESLRNADSTGKFFNSEIKNCYSSERLD